MSDSFLKKQKEEREKVEKILEENYHESRYKAKRISSSQKDKITSVYDTYGRGDFPAYYFKQNKFKVTTGNATNKNFIDFFRNKIPYSFNGYSKEFHLFSNERNLAQDHSPSDVKYTIVDPDNVGVFGKMSRDSAYGRDKYYGIKNSKLYAEIRKQEGRDILDTSSDYAGIVAAKPGNIVDGALKIASAAKLIDDYVDGSKEIYTENLLFAAQSDSFKTVSRDGNKLIVSEFQNANGQILLTRESEYIGTFNDVEKSGIKRWSVDVEGKVTDRLQKDISYHYDYDEESKEFKVKYERAFNKIPNEYDLAYYDKNGNYKDILKTNPSEIKRAIEKFSEYDNRFRRGYYSREARKLEIELNIDQDFFIPYNKKYEQYTPYLPSNVIEQKPASEQYGDGDWGAEGNIDLAKFNSLSLNDFDSLNSVAGILGGALLNKGNNIAKAKVTGTLRDQLGDSAAANYVIGKVGTNMDALKTKVVDVFGLENIDPDKLGDELRNLNPKDLVDVYQASAHLEKLAA